jgi:prepilin signal peptidase PulO-like enzyme (type II secretory pathway)
VQVEYLILVTGMVVALGMGRLVLAWTANPPAAHVSDLSQLPRMRLLPWQTGRAPALVATSMAACGALAVLIAAMRFENVEAARVAVLALAFLACTATDLLAYRVPDAVTLPATAFALVGAATQGQPELASAIGGASMAGGLLLVAAVLTRGGLGGGDVKLGVLIGAALGLPEAAFALAAGIVLGGVVVIGLYAMRWLDREQAFPFAPFLALAALVFLLAI